MRNYRCMVAINSNTMITETVIQESSSNKIKQNGGQHAKTVLILDGFILNSRLWCSIIAKKIENFEMWSD